MDLVAGAIKEAGIDKDHAILGSADRFLEVDGRAAFLIHHTHLESVGLHAEHFLRAGEKLVGESHFFRAVHLRLDDIDRTFARIHVTPVRTNIVQRDQAGEGRIHDAFRHFIALGIENGRVGHQVADIAHQHERTALERQRGTIRRLIGAVAIEAAGHLLAVLFERIF